MSRRGDSSPVLVFNGQRWAETPTFHLHLPWDEGGHDAVRTELERGLARVEHRTVTACGRTWSSWGWTEDTSQPGGGTGSDYRNVDLASMMRRDHAEKIGRLCDRCRARQGDV